jgi:hypothetical protein
MATLAALCAQEMITTTAKNYVSVLNIVFFDVANACYSEA